MFKWFSIEGIMTEVKRIRWPKASDMVKDSLIVIIFTTAFGVFFVAAEAAVAFLLRLIGIGI
jgi:preprotein translocase subunit SecE